MRLKLVLGPGKEIPFEKFLNDCNRTTVQVYALSGVVDTNQAEFWLGSRTVITEKAEKPIEPMVNEEDVYVDEILDSEAEPTPVQKDLLYECPDHGCIMKFIYAGNLARHILLGKHRKIPDKTSLRDYALNLFVRKVEELDLQRTIPIIQDMLVALENTEGLTKKLVVGWALKKKKSYTKFTRNATQFLDEMFEVGQKSKRKIDPKQVRFEFSSKNISF